MSSVLKTTLIVIVLLVIAGGAYWYVTTSPATPAEESPTSTLPTGGDTGDNALDQDLAAIDAQISAFNTDNTGVDQGLGDSQVSQSSL